MLRYIDAYWRVILPLISGYIVAFICPIYDYSHKNPPSYVFGIVWPILYILLGIAWNKSVGSWHADFAHLLCTLFLTSWAPINSCAGNKLLGAYVIAASIASVVACMTLHPSANGTLIHIPLLSWLLFAYQLAWENQ